jgi:pimeloyl-ACP methyl ester carboxylesterase
MASALGASDSTAAGSAPAPITGRPRLWNETRFLWDERSTADPSRWPTPPPGDGRPALLIPGLLAGDASLRRLAMWLRSGGYAVRRSGMVANADCSGRAVDALEARLEQIVARHGARALVIGQSRGGTFGRALTARRPDLVDTLVTLGAPVRDQLAVHPTLWLGLGLMAALGSLRVPGVMSMSCRRGACCAQVRTELKAEWPQDVRFLAVYSRSDGIVNWRACVDPAAEALEVRATHYGMGMNAEVWSKLAVGLRDGGSSRESRTPAARYPG